MLRSNIYHKTRLKLEIPVANTTYCLTSNSRRWWLDYET